LGIAYYLYLHTDIVRVGATAHHTLKQNPHFDPELHLFNYISILWVKALKLELYIN